MPDQRLRAILEFVTKGDQKTKRALQDVAKQSERVEAETGRMGRAQRGAATGAQKMQAALGKVALAAGTVGAALFTAKKAFDLAKEGAQLNQLESSFDSLNKRVFKTPNLLNDMRKAVNGTVDDMTLMAGVMTLTAGATDEAARRFAKASPELLEIAKAANKLNPTLGDTAFLYQSLSTGIKRSSPLILDNLGLTVKIGEANQRYAESLGKTVEELTGAEKQQALLNEVLRAGDILMAQAGDSADSLADAYAQAEVASKNFWNSVKQGVADFVGENVVASKAIEKINQAIDDGVITSREYVDVRNKLQSQGVDALESEVRFAQALELVTDGYVDNIEAGLKLLANERKLLQLREERAIADQKAADAQIRRGRIHGEVADQVLQNYFEEAKAIAVSAEEWEAYAVIQEKNRKITEEYIKVRRGLNEQIARSPMLFEQQGFDIPEAGGEVIGGDIFQGPTIGPILSALADIQRQAGLFRDIARNGVSFFNEELEDLGPTMVMIGGRTAEQSRIFSEAEDNYKRAGDAIVDYQVGLRGFGLDADQVAEKVADLTDEQAHWQRVMGEFSGVQGTANLVTKEATINYEELNKTLFDSILAFKDEEDQIGLTAKQMGAAGLALGELNQSQVDYIVQAAQLTDAVADITQAFYDGELSADQMEQALRRVADGTHETAQQSIEATTRADALGDSLDGLEGFYEAKVGLTVDEQEKQDVSNIHEELDGIGAFYKAEVDSNAADKLQPITALNEELDQFNTARGLDVWAAELDTNAYEVQTEQVDPLQAAVDAWLAGSPYQADFDARTLTAEADIDRTQSAINSLAGTYYIDVQYRITGQPPTPPGVGGRAAGGPVASNTPYIVGERGPELFVPSMSGQIVPNNKISRNNIYNTISYSGDNFEEFERRFDAMMTKYGVRANESRRTI
jgi:hypothetical protein